MQAIAPVTTAQLLAVGQEPLIKIEIYVNGSWVEPWVDLCDMPTERDEEELTDGGMEIWTTPTNLTHWTELDAGGACGIAQEDTIIHGGLYSCKIFTTAPGDWASIDQNFTLVLGASCTLSLWYINTTAGVDPLRIYIEDAGTNVYLKSDGTWGLGAAVPILLAQVAAWTEYELAFTAHATYANYNIRIYKGQGGGKPASVYYIDDASIAMTVALDAVVAGDVSGNRLEGASISLGGAGMTPAPVAGVWSATMNNINSIFHPQHPTSDYKTWLETERLARIFVGGTYGGVDYYWQSIIGYMNEPKFSMPSYKVSISGGDYMQRLQQTELKFLDNYWGSTENFVSVSSEGLTGAELYAEGDAMEIGIGEANNITWWNDLHLTTFVSEVNGGGGSTWVGKMNSTELGNFVANDDVTVGNLTAGTQYKVSFWYQKTAGASFFAVNMYQQVGAVWVVCGAITQLSSTAWVEVSFIFTAIATAAVRMELSLQGAGAKEARIDQISIYEFTPYWSRYYDLTDATETGPFHVTLDGDDVWQAEVDIGWYYAEDVEAGPDPPAHPAGIVFFDINKVVAAGLTIVVYYFIAQAPENVVADLLVYAGLYADQTAALLAMDFDATLFTIDNVWFEVGTNCLKAITMLCERCDYRFYFKYDGTPSFKPKPAAGVPDFIFTDPKQITSISGPYRDKSEIKNRIIIEGMKQAAPVGDEETLPSELKGEANDATSIAAYGERTMTIKNHLFQTQAAIDAMVISLLAEYKDPKWYSDIKMDYNPVPLEIGDTIQWEERLSPTLNITETGVIRDIKIDYFSSTYKCVL